MKENENEVEIKGHSYDGISEFDNPLPTWWLWTFFLTIIFSFIYFIHYEIAGGPTLKQELTIALEEIDKAKAQAPQVMETEASLNEKMKNPTALALGANVYATKCAACHGQELQGLIGPNLTDSYWIHGKGAMSDVVKVIREGVAEKGMPPWGPVLKSDEIIGAAAFVISKKGSQAKNPKAAQGVLVQ